MVIISIRKNQYTLQFCDFSATLDYYGLLFTSATAFGDTGDTEIPK